MLTGPAPLARIAAAAHAFFALSSLRSPSLTLRSTSPSHHPNNKQPCAAGTTPKVVPFFGVSPPVRSSVNPFDRGGGGGAGSISSSASAWAARGGLAALHELETAGVGGGDGDGDAAGRLPASSAPATLADGASNADSDGASSDAGSDATTAVPPPAAAAGASGGGGLASALARAPGALPARRAPAPRRACSGQQHAAAKLQPFACATQYYSLPA